MRDLRDEGKEATEIAKQLKIARASVYRVRTPLSAPSIEVGRQALEPLIHKGDDNELLML